MRRLIPRLLPLAAILVIAIGASGCSSNPDTSNSVTTPDLPITTDTFSGTLTLNGGFTHTFAVNAAGGITATLTTLTGATPDVTVVPIGMNIGTFNTSSVCQQVLPNDQAVQGSIVFGQTSAAGTLCVRVYDAAGTVVAPESYVVTVTHP